MIDQDWILEQVKYLPPIPRKRALERYAFEWGRGFGMGCKNGYIESARKRANEALRVSVEAYRHSMAGNVRKPPIMRK